jgi:hypothetical protein
MPAAARYSSRDCSSSWWRRHLVTLASFLLQPDPPALAVGEVVFDAHRDDGADAREGLDHDADQRTAAQAHKPGRFAFRSIRQSDRPSDFDVREQSSGLILGEDRRRRA